MNLLRISLTRATRVCAVCIALTVMGMAALAQTLSTTTVQGAVYLANGAPGSGTLQVSWPAFTTSSNQAVAAGKLTATIGADGFVSVNLAPNLGSSPAGLYYTAIYHMSDGTTNIEYCRNAASTLQQAAASASALWSGTYKCARVSLDADVWPGDALDINVPSAGLNAQVIIRSVTLNYRASLPDAVQYTIRFANDWADDLAIRTSPAVPADVWLPAPISPSYALNVSGLTVVSLTAGSITINTGTPSPEGGGFEIRRCDNCFAPGTDSDLVMRSAQPNMTFSRLSAWDRFYVRAYDGANPPNYSEFSAALIFNIPLGW